MALGQFSVVMDEETKVLIQEGISVVKALTEEMHAYNNPPVEYAEEMRPPLPHAPEVDSYLGITRIKIGEQVMFHDPSPSGIQAISEGTVRVPEGWVALMLPNDLLRTAIDAVMKTPATPTAPLIMRPQCADGCGEAHTFTGSCERA